MHLLWLTFIAITIPLPPPIGWHLHTPLSDCVLVYSMNFNHSSHSRPTKCAIKRSSISLHPPGSNPSKERWNAFAMQNMQPRVVTPRSNCITLRVVQAATPVGMPEVICSRIARMTSYKVCNSTKWSVFVVNKHHSLLHENSIQFFPLYNSAVPQRERTRTRARNTTDDGREM